MNDVLGLRKYLIGIIYVVYGVLDIIAFVVIVLHRAMIENTTDLFRLTAHVGRVLAGSFAEEESRSFRHRIRNILFGPGGLLGVSYAGFLEVMSDVSTKKWEAWRKSLNVIGGVSVGSLVAALVVAGASPADVTQLGVLFVETFNQQIDLTDANAAAFALQNGAGLVTSTAGIRQKDEVGGDGFQEGSDGILSASILRRSFVTVLQRAGVHDAGSISMREFAERYSRSGKSTIELRVYVSDVVDMKPRIFSSSTTADGRLPLADVLTASAAIPGVFSTVILEGRGYSDGGVYTPVPGLVDAAAEPDLAKLDPGETAVLLVTSPPPSQDATNTIPKRSNQTQGETRYPVERAWYDDFVETIAERIGRSLRPVVTAVSMVSESSARVALGVAEASEITSGIPLIPSRVITSIKDLLVCFAGLDTASSSPTYSFPAAILF